MKANILIFLTLFVTLVDKADAQFTFQRSFGTTYQYGFGGTNEVDVIQTFDGSFCVGGTVTDNNGDMCLLKLDNMGDTIWTRTFGSNAEDVLFSVEQTNDSGFILSGLTRNFDEINPEAYLIRTDAAGNIIWSKTYGSSNVDWFSSIQQTADNGFIACGRTSDNFYLVKIDPDGNIVWTKYISVGSWASSVQQTFDKGFIITGYESDPNDYQICIVKTDSTGNIVWSKITNGQSGEGGQCVKQCTDSGYIITGFTNNFGAGAQDIFLLKIDIDGNFKWMKTYGGVWEDTGYDVEQTADNGFIVSGRTQSFGPGTLDRNIYLLKTDPTGKLIWTRVYGSAINNGYSVQQTNDMGYIIVSNPLELQVIKTDSSGHTGGCNEYNANTLVNEVSLSLLPQSSFTVSIGTANNVSTITNYVSLTGNPQNVQCPVTTLDVKFLMFTVTASNCRNVTLKWETAGELNNKGFEIESSIDGYQFSKIAFVIGKENNRSKNAYSYSISGLSKQVHYFRLRQIDFDGHFNFSPIAYFKNTCGENPVSIFPNPIKNNFQITGLTINKNNVQIFNAMGVKMAEWINTLRNEFNISHLSKGIYFLRVNNREVYKIMKE